MTPWDMWTRALDAGMAGARTGFRFAEMVQASQEVVASRCRTMAAAARDPLRGDYAELGRMAPEKMAAFGSAAASAIDDMHAVQADALACWQQLATMTLAGVPTTREMARLGDRSMRIAERTLAAGGNAMAPVHRAATGNARRLNKGRRAA